MYKQPNNILGEVLSGAAYQQTYTIAHANYTSNLLLFLVPIFLQGDTAYIDATERFKLKSWSFSPLILKEEVQYNNKFWGILGYRKHLNVTSI